MLYTNHYATLLKYQNALMHISEPTINPTLINHVDKVYELEWGPLRLIG